MHTAAPQVAGLAAYYRSVSSPWKQQLTSPAHVKKLIRKFHRRFNVNLPKEHGANDRKKQRPIIWNGQYKDRSCLKDYAVNVVRTDRSKKNCPDIELDLNNQPDSGETVRPCTGSSPRARQADCGSCPLLPDAPGSGGDGGEATRCPSPPDPRHPNMRVRLRLRRQGLHGFLLHAQPHGRAPRPARPQGP